MDSRENLMAPVLVTVCIPTIGRSQMLRETLESLRQQTYSNYEVLILDNGCPIEAQDIIHAYAKDEPRARVLRSEERLHMFENFSRGIEAAKGKYLTFFHDDDVYLPEFLQHQVSLLESNSRIGFSGCNCFIIDSSSCAIGKRELIRKSDVWPGKRYIAALMRLGVNIFPMQGVMFRTCLLRPTPFDRSLGVHFTDFVILMRIAEQHDVGLLAASLLKMRNHDGQASQGLPMAPAFKLREQILLDYCSEFDRRWPKESSFVKKLRGYVMRSRQVGLLWGWISSRTEPEAMECLADLNQGPMEILIRDLLMQVSHHGMSLARRQKILMPALRRIGYGVVKGAL